MNLSWLGPKLAMAFMNLQWLVWLLLGCSLVLGVIAVTRPDRFHLIAQAGARWIDTNRLIQALDKPINIDQFVLRHPRCFGLAVVASTLFLAYLNYRHH